MALHGAASGTKRPPCCGDSGGRLEDRLLPDQHTDGECTAHRHDGSHHRHDLTSPTDPSGAKPAWVSAAGRLLHGAAPPTAWCPAGGPLFRTKRGACARCECLPCPECVHAFQSIRDTLLVALTKAPADGAHGGALGNYSLMFTGLKKNGDVKVDVHHRCCAKHKPRLLSSLTVNTCCRKHKVETCERIVQTLRDNARSARPGKGRRGPAAPGDALAPGPDDLEADDVAEEEEEYEEDEDPEEEDPDAPSGEDCRRPPGGAAAPLR